MKTHLLFLFGIIILFSCADKENKLRQQIEQVAKEQILSLGKADSSLFYIDEFTLHRIDTLTDKVDSLRILNYLTSIYTTMEFSIDSKKEMVNLTKEAVKARLNLAKTSQSFYGNDDIITKMQFERAQQELDRAKKESIDVDSSINELELIKNRIDNIILSIKSHKVDSTTFRGYIAIVGYKGADASKREVVVDTITVTISEHLRAMPYIKEVNL